MPKRILKGKVISDKAEKTVTILVELRLMHPVYKKIIRKSKKYSAHDPQNHFKVGDVIQIIESRPISKTKKWHVVYSDAENIAAV